ncbi:lysophospholipid acyltransferase family protein [Solitalea canadensis]|uniref:1-acyl-sn-glycerol-3-phosphate acyltransferase n=1 Tax=Solitalea canadensis (strain ATCC 29591 / DSM 3403 / JCM 21819 / LMG 8368 / NBRC 15130 / NCIMB 12057 / USAM 9D) TaxID=929556 RepID=H8KX79_SOLCM|nr:lysophospholipid acyltransferase family protein [Solitalea canadensis]AFD08408.1 1-acyl-sn-glycerol-3-phosphate acyltransferase [Solitalea canadensis DSM 3403]
MRKVFAVVQLFLGLVAFVVGLIAALPFVVLATLILPGKTGTDVSFIFLRIWALLASLGSLILFKSFNKYKAPENRAYVYVCNHGSYLDSLAVVLGIHQSFKPLGKIEMAKVPLFDIIYKRLVVMIDRSSKESRQRCVEDLKLELNNGMSVLIFPEGTMNKTDQPLTEFYDGAFRIAIETQTPIAPVVIVNSKQLLPRKNPLAIKPGIVKVVYADVVETAGLTMDDLPYLKEHVYQSMEKLLIAPTSFVLPKLI